MPIQKNLERVRFMKKYFSTSMMCVNMFELNEQFKTIEKYTDMYHIDIMDGHFVPNIALSFDFIKQLRVKTEKPLDVHLMIDNPHAYINRLLEYEVDYITLHPNTIEGNVFQLINKIKSHNTKFGIVLSPSNGIEIIKYYEKYIDKLTIMTVEPGFAGQTVIKEMIDKIKEIHQYREKNNLNFLIEVDGSNNDTTFKMYYESGADIFVLGSYLFKSHDLEKKYQEIFNYFEGLDE